jgi:hypothetical protein
MLKRFIQASLDSKEYLLIMLFFLTVNFISIAIVNLILYITL